MSKAIEIWDNVRSDMEIECTTVSFDVWVKTLTPVCLSENRLILLATNENHRENVIVKFGITLKQVVKAKAPYINDVVIIVESEKDNYTADEIASVVDVPYDVSLSSANEIIKKYTFSNFVVGKCNEYAVSAANVICDEPGEKFNPFFLYGGSGLGKTHIMNAIGNSLQVDRPELNIVYTTSEKFLNDFINSIPTGKSKEVAKSFREKYRKADVLMIDDVQFISGKTATVEELFHTFNELYDSGKQLIFTSDRPPSELRDIEDRLRSRFGWGLIIDVQQPDYETRVAILRVKSQAKYVNLSDDVLSLMATSMDSNIREMESLLNKVIFLSGLTKKAPSVELVYEALKDYRNVTEETMSTDSILDCVCTYFKKQPEDLLGKKRTKDVVEPRQICMYLMTEYTSHPLGTIGDLMGGRDHTTVMHARDKIEKMMDTVSRVKTAVEDIRCMIFKK